MRSRNLTVYSQIEQMAPTHTVKQLSKETGYSVPGVRVALRNLGIECLVGRKGFAPTKEIDELVQLHLSGMSTAEIARETGRLKDSVKSILRHRGVLRQSPGRDIERSVWYWTVGQFLSAMRVKGDRPFDLLVEGEKIDVKSAKETDKKHPRYIFAIHHKLSNRTVSEADWYWFVLKDRSGLPMYRCRTHDIDVKLNTSITFEKFCTDPRFSFVGYLA